MKMIRSQRTRARCKGSCNKKKKKEIKKENGDGVKRCLRCDEIVSVIRRKLTRSGVPWREKRSPTWCSS